MKLYQPTNDRLNSLVTNASSPAAGVSATLASNAIASTKTPSLLTSHLQICINGFATTSSISGSPPSRRNLSRRIQPTKLQMTLAVRI